VASVAVASVATDAGKKTDAAKNAAGLTSALAIATAAGSLTEPACSVNSSNDSSDSEDSDMIGGGDIPPGSPSGDDYEFSEYPADDDDADDNDMPTNAEASRFTFLERLEHYMDRVQTSEDNHKAVELAIMVEAGTTVREMDPMKKEVKEKAFLNSYVSTFRKSLTTVLNMQLLAQRCSLPIKVPGRKYWREGHCGGSTRMSKMR
jgi:hypothetical protein